MISSLTSYKPCMFLRKRPIIPPLRKVRVIPLPPVLSNLKYWHGAGGSATVEKTLQIDTRSVSSRESSSFLRAPGKYRRERLRAEAKYIGAWLPTASVTLHPPTYVLQLRRSPDTPSGGRCSQLRAEGSAPPRRTPRRARSTGIEQTSRWHREIFLSSGVRYQGWSSGQGISFARSDIVTSRFLLSGIQSPHVVGWGSFNVTSGDRIQDRTPLIWALASFRWSWWLWYR